MSEGLSRHRPALKRGYLVATAAEATGKTPQALKKRLERGTLAGWAPHATSNPLDSWVVDADALDADQGVLLDIQCIWLEIGPEQPEGGDTDLEEAVLHREFAEAESRELRNEVLELTKRESDARVEAAAKRAEDAEAENQRLKLAVAQLTSALTGFAFDTGPS